MLSDLADESLCLLHKVQSKSTSVATKSAKHRDMVNNDNFHVEDSVLREQARSTSAEIQVSLQQIFGWEKEIEDVAKKIASTTEALEWIVAERSTYAQAETPVSDEAPIVID